MWARASHIGMTSPRRTATDTTTARALHHLRHLHIIITLLDGPTWRYHRPRHVLYVDQRADVVTSIREALAEVMHAADDRPRLTCIHGDGDGTARPDVRPDLRLVI